ncbi:Cysteine protease atg4 [Ceratobasidium sp. 423]|nr:Cysteine protease atg4 [Ceratobasidium sp. 423]
MPPQMPQQAPQSGDGSSRSRRARRSSPSLAEGSGPSIAMVQAGAGDAELSRSPSSVSQAVAIATRARQSETAVVSSPSSVRLGDISTRLSGWFSHLTGSTTDLGLTSTLGSAAAIVPASPKRAQPRTDGPISSVARPIKGGMDKVMRYLTDSDATPDGCTDPIWLLGVLHAGFEPPDPSASPPPPTSPHRRDSTESSLHVQLHRKNRNPPGAFTHHQNPSLQSISSFTIESGGPSKYAYAWPAVFYEDFTSLIWLTYRSHYSPIRDTSLEALAPLGPCDQEMVPTAPMSASPRRWNWPGSAEKSWTSDAGWGCMLRTGQSLLANALIHLHLGRNWRRPHYPMFAEEHAVYVKILTWFFDTPSPLAPFGVHRMALAGKALGKDVGTWFGPSTAAGSIKTLAHAFPECQLSVSLAVDGTVFASDVYAASHMGMVTPSGRSISSRRSASKWGGRAVLILVNIRLGLDNVNPIYYDALKSLFQFPQSVGISGGRPSSSYYFVGTQADSLFYLDPHHTRPVIPLRPPPSLAPEPSDAEDSAQDESSDIPATPSAKHRPRRDITPDPHPTPRPRVSSPASPASSELGHQRARSSLSPPRTNPNYHLPSASSGSRLTPLIPSGIDSEDGIHYCCAYSAAELRTFHCDRVRKMPMSALDPSMLLGFLCRDDADWKDFRTRVADMSKKTKTLFSIADEPPSWSDMDSDDMGLESVSEPDIDSIPDHDDGDDFYDTHTGETRSAIGRTETSPPGELSTTDESMEVVTPGPRHSARFDTMRPGKDRPTHHRSASSEGEDDDWVDPTPPPADVSQIPGVENGAPASISATPSPDLVPSPSVPSVVSEESSLAESPVRGGNQFPFPAGDDDDEEELVMQHPKAQSTRGATQLRTVRARDGGRTKSGGVKGLVDKEEV